MSKTSFIYFLCAIVVLSVVTSLPPGCNGKNDANGKPRIIKKDSTITLAAFMGYGLKSKHWGLARRISWDTLMVKWNKDSTKADPIWQKYRMYEAEIPIVVDSAYHKVFGDPVLDSLGKPNVIKRLMTIPPQFVVDTIYDLDSAFRYLDKFLVKDSTKK